MGQDYFALKSSKGPSDDRFINWQDTKLEANKTYDLVFARINGVLKTCLGGNFWGSVTGEENKITQFTNFFIDSVNSTPSQQGTAIVTYLRIEGLSDNVNDVCSTPRDEAQ